MKQQQEIISAMIDSEEVKEVFKEEYNKSVERRSECNMKEVSPSNLLERICAVVTLHIKNHFKGLVDGRKVIEIVQKANYDISEFIPIEMITGGFFRR